MKAEKYFFEDDGSTPNSHLPVLVYRQAVPSQESDFALFLERKFQENGWTNNWRVVLNKDHYHSTTHEVLGIAKGSVTLQIGGAKGRQLVVKEGDVILIPAGVGHFSVGDSSNYLVVGGYPQGKSWDMIYNEANKYKAAKKNIEALELPNSHPILGGNGIEEWA